MSDIIRDRKASQLWSLAKICLNRKQYIKCVKYLTKALHFSQQTIYYYMRSETYYIIASQFWPSHTGADALNLALSDCLKAKQLDPFDAKAINLFKEIQKIMVKSGKQSMNMTDNWLLSAQEVTVKITNEKSTGSECSDERLMDYYWRRSVAYEKIGTKESQLLVLSDRDKIRKLMTTLYNSCHKLSKLSSNTSSEVKTSLEENNYNKIIPKVQLNGDLSDEEIYYSDEDIV